MSTCGPIFRERKIGGEREERKSSCLLHTPMRKLDKFCGLYFWFFFFSPLEEGERSAKSGSTTKTNFELSLCQEALLQNLEKSVLRMQPIANDYLVVAQPDPRSREGRSPWRIEI